MDEIYRSLIQFNRFEGRELNLVLPE
jgi:hypothetical protein